MPRAERQELCRPSRPESHLYAASGEDL